MNRKHTAERLKPIIAESRTWADVCRALRIKPATGAQSHIKKVSERFKESGILTLTPAKADVVEMADTLVLETSDRKGYVGSSPTIGTILV